MEKGWIKLHRIFTEWEWYHDPLMVHLFLYLVITANNRDGEWRLLPVKKGQLITGRKELSKNTGLSEQSIRTCLAKLKSTNEITIKSTNKYSLITINKYEQYQTHPQSQPQPQSESQDQTEPHHQPATNQQSTSNQPAINQQSTTNKKDKNIKKDKKVKNTKYSIVVPPVFEKINFFEIYHSSCPNLPKILIQSETRKKMISARISEFGEEKLLQVFKLVGESDFLNGKNEKKWNADLDWILKPANFIKILENKYKNKLQSHEDFKPNDPRASQIKGWDIPL
jgi:hypothetical protein